MKVQRNFKRALTVKLKSRNLSKKYQITSDCLHGASIHEHRVAMFIGVSLNNSKWHQFVTWNALLTFTFVTDFTVKWHIDIPQNLDSERCHGRGNLHAMLLWQQGHRRMVWKSFKFHFPFRLDKRKPTLQSSCKIFSENTKALIKISSLGFVAIDKNLNFCLLIVRNFQEKQIKSRSVHWLRI